MAEDVGLISLGTAQPAHPPSLLAPAPRAARQPRPPVHFGPRFYFPKQTAHRLFYPLARSWTVSYKSSVAFQKQEIATLDKFYLYHTPEILRSRPDSRGPNFQLQMKGFIFKKSGKSFFSKIQSFEALDCQPPRSRGLASRTQTKQAVFVKTKSRHLFNRRPVCTNQFCLIQNQPVQILY